MVDLRKRDLYQWWQEVNFTISADARACSPEGWLKAQRCAGVTRPSGHLQL